MGLSENPRSWCANRFFNWVHGNHLVYNTCWEDPRLDRIALDITPNDSLMVITSAGCNALDYLLDSPAEVHAVDLNYRQNALLELKIAGIRSLEFETFFQIFGEGSSHSFHDVYRKRLRPELTDISREYWDENQHFFGGNSFYFRGTAGLFARIVHAYIDFIKLRAPMLHFFSSRNLEDQRSIYEHELSPHLWRPFIEWMMKRSSILALLGVPLAQRQTIERTYPGGIFEYVRDCLDSVFMKLPVHDNYFWALYFDGKYTKDRCPEYLKADNFGRLKTLVDRIQIHTTSVTEFLNQHQGEIQHFVLLDHMDWMNVAQPQALKAEWQAIAGKASKNAKAIWRSGGLEVDFVDPIEVQREGQNTQLKEVLRYNTALSKQLHQRDRVHTYGSFYIAEFAA
ncbi:MAG: BtaA family protein [Bdellovibrionaceae bacterium]|nr:BtaA family protein [Bdellovibrionales bacterium]MCB9254547.1 BtaA family protein [Pseudobdellovibrionaceae bacterium]